MKKWNQFLKEREQQVLQEFNAKDEKDVMSDESRFSVSFEGELETEGSGDGEGGFPYGGVGEARREAAAGYLGYDVEEYFRETEEETDVDQIMSDNPSDADGMYDWYYEEISELYSNDIDLIRMSIAISNDESEEEIKKEFEKAIASASQEDAKKFLKLIILEPDRYSAMQDLLGWTNKQMSLAFEVEGGKEYPIGIEKLSENPKIIRKLISHFVINLEELNSQELLSGVKVQAMTVGLKNFLFTFTGDDDLYDKIIEKSDEYMQDAMDDFTGRYGTTVGDVINMNIMKSQFESLWVYKIIEKYRMAVDDKFEEYIEERTTEFENDPAQYLEDMGIEDYFDEDEWMDSQYGHGGGDCSTDSLTDELRNNFPDFMNKWEDQLDFKEDGSLDCGIEFAMQNPPYMTGLSTAIEFIEDFFEEYDEQSVFSFTDKTGLHINVGYLDENGTPYDGYNLFKGLTFINQSYATKGVGFPEREHSEWAGDLKKPALKNIAAFLQSLPEDSEKDDVMTKKEIMKLYFTKNFDELSNILSARVSDTARSIGTKGLGFNVNYSKSRKYIEFRYPGKTDTNLESVKKALMYYSFVVKSMADPEFKKKSYVKDLIGFVNKLQGEKVGISKMSFHKEIKKGQILAFSTYRNSISLIIESALKHSISMSPNVKEYTPRWPGDNAPDEWEKTTIAREVTRLTQSGFGLQPDFHRLTRDTVPNVYLGIDPKLKKVILRAAENEQEGQAAGIEGLDTDTLQTLGIFRQLGLVAGDGFRPETSAMPRIFKKEIPIKEFQSGVDSYLYHYVEGGDYNSVLLKDYYTMYKELSDIIMESKSPLEMSKRFISFCNKYGDTLLSIGDDFRWKEE